MRLWFCAGLLLAVAVGWSRTGWADAVPDPPPEGCPAGTVVEAYESHGTTLQACKPLGCSAHEDCSPGERCGEMAYCSSFPNVVETACPANGKCGGNQGPPCQTAKVCLPEPEPEPKPKPDEGETGGSCQVSGAVPGGRGVLLVVLLGAALAGRRRQRRRCPC
ncbi:MAG: hypothetical protein HY744_15960 [Deltaproteobacteria bacterium]|nr:hypothetical protein [Deltaproteobacteria bacterium]